MKAAGGWTGFTESPADKAGCWMGCPEDPGVEGGGRMGSSESPAETARLSPQQRPTVQSLNGAQTVSVSGMVWLATQIFFRINSLR